MTPEEAQEFWKRYIEAKNKSLEYPEFDPKIETFPEYVERYIKEAKLPVPEEKNTIIDMLGLSLFRKISAFFTMMWENVFDALHRASTTIMTDIFNLFIKQMVTKATPGIKEKLIELGKLQNLPAEISEPFMEQLGRGTPTDYVWSFLMFGFLRIVTLYSALAGANSIATQDVLSKTTPTIPDPMTLMRARLMSPGLEKVSDNYLQRLGFSEVARGIMKLTSHTLLAPDDVKKLFLRGEISRAEKGTMLKAIGVREEDIARLEKLYYFIPSPTDLVRMAVREAFYPDYIAKYGLMAEYPPEFEKWAKTQGMSPQWARKFWVSHWVLPSIMQGYEMLHRGVISKVDLDSLFKAVDIAPFWRSKLLAISYSPYTRIDIRRMYRTGVVDRAEVKKTYLALGYDDEHAENLTEFTVRDAVSSEKDLSKADIVGAYQRKLFTRSEAKDLISAIGYSSEEAEIYLDRADFDSFKKDKDKKLSWIKKNYLAGLLSYNDANGRLSKLNLRGGEVTELFRDWDIEKEGKMTELTFAQLQVLLIQKIIDEPIFKSELKNKGYSDKYVDWLMKLTKQKIVQGE